MPYIDLLQVLAAPQLTGVIQARSTGTPQAFPEPFYVSGPSDRVLKNNGSFFRTYGNRQAARVAAYGAPSRAVQLRSVEAVPVVLIHTVENITFPVDDFQQLIRMDSSASRLQIDEKGADEIAQQVREFRSRFDVLRTSAIAFALASDQVSFDISGRLLPSNSGAVFSVSSGVPAAHQAQLGGLISQAWSDPATDIAAQVRALKEQAILTTGLPLKYAFYGKNVASYLVNNTSLENFFIRNPVANNQFVASGEIPNPLLGLTWLPVYDSFYEDASGNNQTIVGPDQVIFTPEPGADWWGLLEGTKAVPTNIGIVADDAAQSLLYTAPQRGMFAYSTLTPDPIAIKMIAGDTFLPVIKNPSAIYQAVVNF